MKVIYIAHALRGDEDDNLAEARRYCHAAVLGGYAPVAPYLEGYLHEEKPGDRQLGLAVDFAIIPRVDELWLCGDRLSDGMVSEARVAQRSNLTVRRVSLGANDRLEWTSWP